MFADFFYLLRFYGVPVTVTEWRALMCALALRLGPAASPVLRRGARLLVKSEAHFDQYDQAFQHLFGDVETPDEIADEVWRWLADPLEGCRAQRRRAAALPEALEDIDLEALRRCSRSDCGSRRRRTTAATVGGHRRHRPFGQLRLPPGWRPGRRREPGQGAVKVAGERRYRSYRTDPGWTSGSSSWRCGACAGSLAQRGTPRRARPGRDGRETARRPAVSASSTTRAARHRQGAGPMDVGGSMHPYVPICSRLFTASTGAPTSRPASSPLLPTSCVYDHLFTGAAHDVVRGPSPPSPAPAS